MYNMVLDERSARRSGIIREHTNGRIHETEFCRLAFSINQTRWMGGRRKPRRKTTVHKSPTLCVRGIYNPILSDRANYIRLRAPLPPQQIQTHR